MALISGRARGPGRAAALRFAVEGAIVVDGDLRHESELKAQRLVARAGGAALTPGPLDATDEDSVRAWVEEAADAFGGIDILYANANAVRFGAVDTPGSRVSARRRTTWAAGEVGAGCTPRVKYAFHSDLPEAACERALSCSATGSAPSSNGQLARIHTTPHSSSGLT
ncbi:SDR family oxidoreductase [Streptomyces coeruleorubidus]|uniref:SDR family oxidoreductase n=1 Tax=Streptomyces coeruleorubidus TaxID=116188 RepID=UPI0033ABF323